MFDMTEHQVLQRARSGRKSRGGGGGTHYNFGMDSSIDTDNYDGHSLTYSASSSQAGESTDSSIADVTYLLESQQHVPQQLNSQRIRQEQHQGQIPCISNEISHNRGRDCWDSSECFHYFDQGPGQTSNSNEKIIFSAASNNGSNHRMRKSSRPRKVAAESNMRQKHFTPISKKELNRPSSYSSPAAVASSDFSSGGGSGSMSSHTPSSPTPPRHAKKKMTNEEATEMWYAKWWMCGFTDALNLN